MSLDQRANAFRALAPGARVRDADGEPCTVTHQLSASMVLVCSDVTGQPRRLAADTLRLLSATPQQQAAAADGPGPSTQDEAPQAQQQDLLNYSEKEWQQARRRLSIIWPMLEGQRLQAEQVRQLARSNGVSMPTLYRWAGRFRTSGQLSALVPAKRGPKEGSLQLDESVETIVRGAIEECYLDPQRLRPATVAKEIQRQCRIAGLMPPHADTVRQRILSIAPALRARRRGQREISEAFLPQRGSFPNADFPLAVVQVDHTPADIIVVDEVSRKAMGKPFLTTAIDVYSRMVVGLYLSLDPPSAASVGICLANAMMPKREYLARLGVKGEWPVWGRIATVHCDNAKEFRGQVLERACEQYGISLEWRPTATPRYGGHVERLIGTLMREVHKLPGTTFSNPRERKGYDSEARAALTLRELEQVIVEFVVNVYHQRRHSAIQMSPLRKWEIGITGEESGRPATGLLPMPADPERLLLDFLPFVERTVQPYGLLIDNINYYHPVLDRHIHAMDDGGHRKKRFVVRRDPRDISRVHWFDDEAGAYVAIPYRNSAHPPMSLFELREVQRRLKADGQGQADEALIFEGLDRMRERVASAKERSAKARRDAARSAPRPSAAPAGRTAGQPAATAAAAGTLPGHWGFGQAPAAPASPTQPRSALAAGMADGDIAPRRVPLAIDDDFSSREPQVFEDVDFDR